MALCVRDRTLKSGVVCLGLWCRTLHSCLTILTENGLVEQADWCLTNLKAGCVTGDA